MRYYELKLHWAAHTVSQSYCTKKARKTRKKTLRKRTLGKNKVAPKILAVYINQSRSYAAMSSFFLFCQLIRPRQEKNFETQTRSKSYPFPNLPKFGITNANRNAQLINEFRLPFLKPDFGANKSNLRKFKVSFVPFN